MVYLFQLPGCFFYLFDASIIIVLHDVCLCRRAHRLTVLIIFSMVLVYVALWEGVTYDSDYNTKRLVLSAFSNSN